MYPHRRIPTFDELCRLPFLLPFQRFTDLQEGSIDPQTALQRYTDYQKHYETSQNRSFFQHYKSHAFMLEKYHPVEHENYLQEMKQEKQGLYKAFVADLKQGHLESLSLSEEQTEWSFAVPAKNQGPIILIRTLPPTITLTQLKQVLKPQLPQMIHIALGDPNPTRKFLRVAWIELSKDSDPQKAIELIENQKVDSFSLQCQLHRPPLERIRHVSVSSASIRRDLEWIRRLSDYFNARYQLEDPFVAHDIHQRTPSSSLDAESAPLKEVTLSLDKYVAYLRRVFHWCFYCGEGAESDFVLIRKCGHIHLRRLNETASLENDYISRNEKIILHATPPPPISYSDTAFQSYLSQFIQEKEAEKWRCLECQKLFRGPDFVLKHLQLKHVELQERFQQEQVYFERFVADSERPQQRQPFDELMVRQLVESGSGHYSSRNDQRNDYRSRRTTPYQRPQYERNTERPPPPPPSATQRPIRSYLDLDQVEESLPEFNYN